MRKDSLLETESPLIVASEESKAAETIVRPEEQSIGPQFTLETWDENKRFEISPKKI